MTCNLGITKTECDLHQRCTTHYLCPPWRNVIKMKVLPPLMVNPPSLLIAPLLQDAAPFYLMRCMEFKLLLLSGDIGVANFQLTGNTLIDGFQQISNLCVPSNVLQLPIFTNGVLPATWAQKSFSAKWERLVFLLLKFHLHIIWKIMNSKLVGTRWHLQPLHINYKNFVRN